MLRRGLALTLGVVAVLVAASTAPAKRLGAFYYTGSSSPPETGTPRLGARAFELRFDNGYVTGVVAAAKLDRFLSFGVNLERFAAQGYRLSKGVVQEPRRLAAPLEPLRVTRRLLARSR
jgi:hypothetical protein